MRRPNAFYVVQRSPQEPLGVEVATYLDECEATVDAALRQEQCTTPGVRYEVDPTELVGPVIITFPGEGSVAASKPVTA